MDAGIMSFAGNGPLETTRNLEFLAFLESEAVDAGEEGGREEEEERVPPSPGRAAVLDRDSAFA